MSSKHYSTIFEEITPVSRTIQITCFLFCILWYAEVKENAERAQCMWIPWCYLSFFDRKRHISISAFRQTENHQSKRPVKIRKMWFLHLPVTHLVVAYEYFLVVGYCRSAWYRDVHCWRTEAFRILYVDKVVESSSDEDNDGYLSEVF